MHTTSSNQLKYPIKIITLQSKNNNNYTYIESHNIQLLFDTKINNKQTQTKLTTHNQNIENIHTLIISHDHHNHNHYLNCYQQKFDLPINITKKTLTITNKKKKLNLLNNIHYFKTNSTLHFNKITIKTIPTPHNTINNITFIINNKIKHLKIIINLKHPFTNLVSSMKTLNTIIIKNNHNSKILTNNPYPKSLKQRIHKHHNHLSNNNSTKLLHTTNNKLK